MSTRTYSFGGFRLLPTRGVLLEGEMPIRLGNRAFEILTVLVERAGELISHEDLTARVWNKTVVSEGNLRVHLTAIRKALRDGDGQVQYIINIPGQGYRFVAPVARHAHDCTAEKAAPRIPIPLTQLVGRTEIIKEIINDIPIHRFVTIVGAGGMGKTGVALAIGHEMSDSYGNGVCFVDLTSLSDPKLVPTAVAAAIRLPLMSEAPLQAIIDFLSDKRMLIILDNCEHVIRETAELVETILKAVHHVHFLSTSREPFRSEGECIRRLPPLATPSEDDTGITAEQALKFAAIQLFVERAAASLNSFQLTDGEAPAVAELCRKLDGIPLAIELAAARIDVFAVSDLAGRLGDCLSILNRGRRTAQPRHLTLRATLDWSFALLPDVEQLLLARLGVFKSNFSREAAIQVTSCRVLTTEAILDGLTNLAAKSLVSTNFSGGRVYYRLLDTTRVYALEKLDQRPKTKNTHRQHAEYCRDHAMRLQVQMAGGDFGRLEKSRELIDDIRSAIQWSLSPAGDAALGLELTVASAFVWYQLSLLDEFRSHAELALERIGASQNPAPEVEIKLLVRLGPALYNTLGPIAPVRAAFNSALKLAEKTNDVDGQIWALRGIWQYNIGMGDYCQAMKLVEDFGRRASGLEDSTCLFHRMKAITHMLRGELATAREHGEFLLQVDTAAKPEKQGLFDYDRIAFTHAMLARILWMQGFPSQALTHARDSVNRGITIKHSLSICFATALAACPVALWAGEVSTARQNLRLLEEHSSQFSLGYWHRFMKAYKLAMELRGADNQGGVRLAEQSGWTLRHLEEFSVLGEGFATDALVSRAKSEHLTWSSAEVLRLEAAKALRQNRPKATDKAVDLLSQSLKIAKHQGALSWELRTATDLGEIWCKQGHAPEAYTVIRSAVDKFTEGFESCDYKKALLLLKAVKPSKRRL